MCGRCGGAFGSDIEGRLIGEYDEIEIPPIKPHVVRHRRFACQCPRPDVGEALSVKAAEARDFEPRG
jgi:hypothetical protein